MRTCLSLSVNKIHRVFTSQPCLLPSFLTNFVTLVPKPGKGSRNAAAIMSSPTGSPFADVIQSLAGLHQEHHKALMDMRADQERRFCALVQNQREDRELFQSWMDREVRAGENPIAPAPPPTCRYRRWGRRMTRRHSSTSSRRPRRHVGGPRRTGQCASSPC